MKYTRFILYSRRQILLLAQSFKSLFRLAFVLHLNEFYTAAWLLHAFAQLLYESTSPVLSEHPGTLRMPVFLRLPQYRGTPFHVILPLQCSGQNLNALSLCPENAQLILTAFHVQLRSFDLLKYDPLLARVPRKPFSSQLGVFFKLIQGTSCLPKLFRAQPTLHLQRRFIGQ